MAYHLDWLSKFRMKASTLNKADPGDRLLLMTIALKCADISNSCKPLPVYSRWTRALMEEFYAQGDAEREHGLTISPFMDRQKPESFANSQKGFFKILAEPLISPFAEFLGPSASVVLGCLHQNMTSLETP
eukprot:TRINITY_DN1380_c0_g1_i6.p2 TRINITY_DN1380_c0_g1~~TRINITY_DN1380_c0_g1_i6.p2  ORF type:complete len:131 (-),score=23.95 TRINITY_DN1380_c0_g1_i6:84-476(-)